MSVSTSVSVWKRMIWTNSGMSSLLSWLCRDGVVGSVGGRRWDVGVEGEEVVRVMEVLERGEPLEPIAVGGIEPGAAFVRDEVRVDPVAVGPQRLPGLPDPLSVAVGFRVVGEPTHGDA